MPLMGIDENGDSGRSTAGLEKYGEAAGEENPFHKSANDSQVYNYKPANPGGEN
jgi:hypothetical protein